MTRVNFADQWDQLLSEGKSSFTVADLVERTGATPNAVYGAVKYAIDRKRLFSPVRGLYVVVPAEYRSSGVTPAIHFIDPMMRHLAIGYYVAFASAAQWWGAADQAPQEFQVVTDRRVRDRDIERMRLRFAMSVTIDTDAVRRVAGPRTMMDVAGPDLCAVDLAGHPSRFHARLAAHLADPDFVTDATVYLVDPVAAGDPRTLVHRWILGSDRHLDLPHARLASGTEQCPIHESDVQGWRRCAHQLDHGTCPDHGAWT